MIPDPKTYYDALYSRAGKTAKAVENLCYKAPHQVKRRNATRKVLQQILEPGAAVLELGCAGGWWTAEMAPVAGSIIAVDVVAWLVEQAPKFDHVEYRVADWNDLRFAKSTFDFILTLNVFEHEPDVAALLAKLYRWTRPGGKMLATVPVSEKKQPVNIAFDVKGATAAKVAGHGSGHVHAFRPATFNPVVEAAGWEITHSQGDGIYYMVVAAKPGKVEPVEIPEPVKKPEPVEIPETPDDVWTESAEAPDYLETVSE